MKIALSFVMVSFMLAAPAENSAWDGKLVQFGGMHEAIGQRQMQARTRLDALLERPHLFALGALEDLQGEITVLDGKPVVTQVADASPAPASAPAQAPATLLLGAYVPAWTERHLAEQITAEHFDRQVREEAKLAGVDHTRPFPFQVSGEFSNARVHVINGACPMQARLKRNNIPQENLPYEATLESIKGVLLGFYAEDAVGKMTHPGTTTHLHLVYEDAASGSLITAHVEEISVKPGATLSLPATESTPDS